MCPAVNSSSSSSSSSSRWCPTPEQLMILEEMYRSGTRTPNAPQIQQITAHLSFYGKIEGKNVFYWFQNHKARDRQKLRRKLYKQLQQQQLLFQHRSHHRQHMMMTNNHHHYHHLGPSNHHFLGHNSTIDSPFHQQHLLFYNWPLSDPSIRGQVQGTGVVEDHKQYAQRSTHNHNDNYNQMMSYTWKMEIPSAGGDHQMRQVDLKGNSMMMRSMYGHDWTTMLDNTSPCNTNSETLKTLELFPVTATDNLKDDRTTSSKHDHDNHDDLSP